MSKWKVVNSYWFFAEVYGKLNLFMLLPIKTSTHYQYYKLYVNQNKVDSLERWTFMYLLNNLKNTDWTSMPFLTCVFFISSIEHKHSEAHATWTTFFLQFLDLHGFKFHDEKEHSEQYFFICEKIWGEVNYSRLFNNSSVSAALLEI